MPVSFTRLRIAGFKSFAEPVTVEILPGLTGIVGPNGCGKSNVVEALRWAMGESSARTLRGAEMDDIIFAGTGARASRNIAEVTISLDGTHGLAPLPFADAPELEVVRRIERGGGSAFRVNGREVRARDVQTLFADLATGARSSAMVSQGRVHGIVAARPEERRSILEEAAGITGLHARRHEAELKLRATEANLARAEDLRGQLERQAAGLRQQAKQAARHRAVAEAIRAAELELMAIQRALAERARTEAEAALAVAHAALTEAGAASALGAAHAAAAAEALPPLRAGAADARAALERARVAGEQIAAEAGRAEAALRAASQRRDQISRDLGHAEQVRQDASLAIARLTSEAARLAAEDAAHPQHRAAAERQAADAVAAMQAAEAAAQIATERSADLVARHRAASEALAAAEQRARRVDEQAARLLRERDQAAAQAIAPERIAAAGQARDTARQAVSAAQAALEAAERARTTAQAAVAGVRERAVAADTARAKLVAATQGLAEQLAVKDGERWPRMVDQLTVPAGLEAALGAALGEELESAADTGAARHWRELPPLAEPPPLPGGAQPLLALVRAPSALARALSQLGLVDSDEAGLAGQPALRPGQSLVSRAGAIWRWDGYTVRAGTPSAAAVRLQQRNRLAALRTQLAEAEQAATEARAARASAEVGERTSVEAEQRARAARCEAEQTLERVRAALAALIAQDAAAAARTAALADQVARALADQHDAAGAATQAGATLSGLADPAAGRAAMERARLAATQARSAEGAVRAARDGFARAAAGRAHRGATLGREQEEWRGRAADTIGRVTDLRARAAEAAREHAALAAAPAHLAARRADAEATLAAAGAEARRTAVALASAEAEATARDRAAHAAEAASITARERLVRAEGEAVAAAHAWGSVAERILERLGAHAPLPEPPPGCTPDTEDRTRRRLDRLTREGHEMGPVNMRAETEAAEADAQIATILGESEEITTAIAKLRGSIGHINREGRERLGQVFTDIDRHFQALFSRMFGGGRAHLAMVGSDDPLLAGLEIYAQPPGKKLATLSLLSGGEQALTALSLIFAVFRCNPAPICVLDEVDAPLDDANVERFCTLLDEMVRETGTRFMVVTHHQLTMARMDRLYGVTMQERGVSRVLSVDLALASAMVDAARLAAE